MRLPARLACTPHQPITALPVDIDVEIDGSVTRVYLHINLEH